MGGNGSRASSKRVFAKKELFEAVMGVVGVLGSCREAGGLMGRSAVPFSCSAATLAAVGMFNGPRFSGGNRRGSRLFLTCVFFFSSVLAAGGAWFVDLRLDLRCSLTVSTAVGGGTLVVGLLWLFRLIVMLSRAPRLDFFLANEYMSVGASFGDSYALGMAGTGGTSSSSPEGNEPWLVVCFGAGSREVEDD
jgi:hypothetical protein